MTSTAQRAQRAGVLGDHGDSHWRTSPYTSCHAHALSVIRSRSHRKRSSPKWPRGELAGRLARRAGRLRLVREQPDPVGKRLHVGADHARLARHAQRRHRRRHRHHGMPRCIASRSAAQATSTARCARTPAAGPAPDAAPEDGHHRSREPGRRRMSPVLRLPSPHIDRRVPGQRFEKVRPDDAIAAQRFVDQCGRRGEFAGVEISGIGDPVHDDGRGCGAIGPHQPVEVGDVHDGDVGAVGEADAGCRSATATARCAPRRPPARRCPAADRAFGSSARVRAAVAAQRDRPVRRRAGRRVLPPRAASCVRTARGRRGHGRDLVVWHGISVTYSSCGQAASAGRRCGGATMRSSRAFRSFLVNFHSNGVAICS